MQPLFQNQGLVGPRTFFGSRLTLQEFGNLAEGLGFISAPDLFAGSVGAASSSFVALTLEQSKDSDSVKGLRPEV